MTTDLAEINTTVQIVLADHTVTPHRRALISAQLIEGYARTEFGVPEEVALDIPLGWEHRVAGLAEQWQASVPGILFIPEDIAKGTPFNDGEFFDAPGAIDAKQEWFDAVGTPEQEEKFRKFWDATRENAGEGRHG